MRIPPLNEAFAQWALQRNRARVGESGGEELPAAAGLAYATGNSLAARGLAAFRPLERPRLLSALRTIRSDQGYDHWFRTGAAIHSWDPTGEGLKVFKAWSALAPGYQTDEAQAACEKKWAEYAKPKPGKRLVTIASVFEEAGAVSGIEGEVDRPAVDVTGEVGEKVNGHHVLSALPSQFTAEPAIKWPDAGKKGKPMATCRNTRLAIQRLGLICDYDVFHDRMRVGGELIGEWAGELTDHAVHALRLLVEREFRFDPGTVAANDAAIQECLQHSFNPVLDYLDGLKWDGVPRLEHWMVRYLGAEDSAYVRAVSCLSLLAAVRRARHPGYKFDQIIVLEGPEGKGKSSAIEILAGSDNFSDQTVLSLDDRGVQEALRGVWLFEIADLAGHSKAEVERIKAFASRTTDRARAAYARHRQDIPRRCVFFATTNNDTYLKSHTGNRRFWPVLCSVIDLAGLSRDRDQLWAEAAAREPRARLVLPEVLWGHAGEVQESRRERDPWDDAIKELAVGKFGVIEHQAPDARGIEYRVTNWDLMNLVLGIPADRMNEVTARRVAYAMRRAGWDGPKVFKKDKISVRGYTKALVTPWEA